MPMAELDAIIEEVRKVAGSVAAELEFEFVHAEVVGSKRDSVVRVYIDKPGGVNLDDCSRFSHAVEAVFDERDLMPGAYVLEISSPGIERELYSLADFVKFKGELARVKLKTELDGQKNFVGRIAAVEGDEIEIEDRTRGSVTFPYSTVAKANLKIDLGKEFKSR